MPTLFGAAFPCARGGPAVSASAPARKFRREVMASGYSSPSRVSSQAAASLDRSVRALQDRLRDHDAQGSRGLQVDNKVDVVRLLDRHLGGAGALFKTLDL